MIRLFTAIEIPEFLRDRLAGLQGGVPNARWVEPEEFHITLRFIGEVHEDVATDIDEALQMIRPPAFPIALKGAGWFGGKTPHSLYIGVEKSPALAHLAAKIESTLVRLGLDPEPRKFTPHLTLARLNYAPDDKVAEFVQLNNLFATNPFAIERFVLFSSHMGSSPHYIAERTYDLAT